MKKIIALTRLVTVPLITLETPAFAASPELHDIVVSYDNSASTTATDRARWAEVADEKVGHILGPGDTLSLYVIGSNTAERAPVLEIRIPPGGKGLAEDAKARRAIQGARQRLRDAIRTLMNAPSDPESDVIGLFERLHPVAGRKMLVLMFGDAIQSTSSVDFERVNLRVEGTRVANKFIEEYRWGPRRLTGAVIDFVLDSPVAKRHRNTRVDLREFYRELVHRIGGEVRVFDSAAGVNLQPIASGGAK